MAAAASEFRLFCRRRIRIISSAALKRSGRPSPRPYFYGFRTEGREGTVQNVTIVMIGPPSTRGRGSKNTKMLQTSYKYGSFLPSFLPPLPFRVFAAVKSAFEANSEKGGRRGNNRSLSMHVDRRLVEMSKDHLRKLRRKCPLNDASSISRDGSDILQIPEAAAI